MPSITLHQALNLAHEYQSSGRTVHAVALCQQILTVQPAFAGALHLLGIIACQCGRNEEAIEWIQRAILSEPRNPAAHCNLGEAYRATGRLADALASYRQAIQLNPNYALAHFKLGNAFNELGQIDDAVAAYRRALEQNPDYLDAQNNFGIALAKQGKFAVAAAAFSHVVQMKPNHPEAYGNLGTALAKQGRFKDALSAYTRAVELNPAFAAAWNELGVTLIALLRFDEAIAVFARAIQIQPGYAEAFNNLGHAQWKQHKINEAIATYRHAISLKPDYAEAYNNLGIALTGNREADGGVAAFRCAIQLDPSCVEAYNNLGIALKEEGNLDEAIAAHGRALDLKPDFPDAQNNLAVALTAQGRFYEALAAYRQALQLKPEDLSLRSNMIYSLLFAPRIESQMISDQHAIWNRKVADSTTRSLTPRTRDRPPQRRLRIGYVSPDFRDHVVGRNLVPLFRHHAPGRFEILCYSGVTIPDELTKEFRRRAHHWRNIVGVPDETVAKIIQADEVDILVDLTQHMAGNRLPLFARQPAPIQVSFAGYPDSAGLDAIEYRISDPWLENSPPENAGSQPTFVSRRHEQVYLLDSFWCYDPLETEVQVSDLPAADSASITFGCLNNFCKVNDPLLKIWARVLGAVKNSRLMILSQEGSHRQRTRQFFEEEGVESHRIEFVVPRPRSEYLERHHRLDIVLDTFPYNGHTTSLDALWMGVPVVSLCGEQSISRAGLSQLSNLNLSDLVAFTEDQYVDIAVRLANDIPRLKELRATLRPRMEKSALMDASRFARQIEASYRSMWHHWCNSREA